MESITSDGQQTTFTTLAGTFMTGASAAWAPTWPDWDKNAPAGLAMIVKKYPIVVDLDQYHFLVARMTHTGTYMALAVNGWDTKVCYTTGLHAVDLRDVQKPSLRGRQAIELRLTFLNTGARVTLDEVRLVDALTPEEQAGFIPAGLDLRLERREPSPYHGLEALNARAGAPVRFDFPEERAVFRDTSTGAVVWKLTRSVRTESADNFNPDGSALPIYNRSFRAWSSTTHGEMRELKDLQGSPCSAARSGRDVLAAKQRNGRPARYVIRAVNFRTAPRTSPTGQAPIRGRRIRGLAVLGSPCAGTEGRPRLYLIDPRRRSRVSASARAAADADEGASLSHNDQRVNWQRCYYFQPWQMDLQTGAVQSLAIRPTADMRFSDEAGSWADMGR